MFDILLITGAAGSGKSSTAQAWAASRRDICAHLSHDDVTLFIKSGFVSPAQQNTEEAERQWRIALTICSNTAQLYAKEGIRCAIDTFLLPHALPFWQGLSHLRVGLLVLQPPVEFAVDRNSMRIQHSGWGVPSWHVYENHAAMRAWEGHPAALVLDNASLSVDQVVESIDAWEQHSLPTSLWAV